MLSSKNQERETETERDRDREKQTETETERHRERGRETDRETERVVFFVNFSVMAQGLVVLFCGCWMGDGETDDGNIAAADIKVG